MGGIPLKIRLVFDSWCKDGQFINDEKTVELSSTAAQFHSGTVFEGEIELDKESEKELTDAIDSGYKPVFYCIEPKEEFKCG